MNASFEERSVWIQLLSMVIALGGYFVVAGLMAREGVPALPTFVPLFAAAVVLMVVINLLGHIVAALTGRPEDCDERDRLIGWRAESNASWVLGAGVLAAIVGLIASVDSVWIAHLLLLAMFLSEVTKYAMQLVYYRRGM